jgi:glycerol-3-phosphate cytidylyltransferase
MVDNVVYVIGVFDLFHQGHLQILLNAKKFGNRLIVAINSDRLVADYKRPPIIGQEDRLEIVRALRVVDEAFIIDSYMNREFIEHYKVNIIVHGDDWPRKGYLKQIGISEEYLLENDIKLELIPYTKGISTSEIIKKIRSSNAS